MPLISLAQTLVVLPPPPNSLEKVPGLMCPAIACPVSGVATAITFRKRSGRSRAARIATIPPMPWPTRFATGMPSSSIKWQSMST